ncbi:MAG TPA: type 1 glutamine amidotransferase domain-containing protein [Polyangiaceae bacterium]|nr:type 1 glutamine amidotransferase domain-containing protein [Polyangiaceae bacterium]
MNLDKEKLSGKKIGILAGDGFEYAELAVPKAALKAAGADVEVISLHEGRIRGMNLTEPTRTVHVDRPINRAAVDDYDGLLIVGGFVGPDFVRQNERARSFVRAFDEAFKPIATLCHGPWVLISAGCANGRRLASWPGVRDDIVNAGGIWRDEPLVRDRNWVSSRSPADLPVFVPAIVELFARGADAPATGALASASTADESSPPPREPIRLALKAARHLPSPTVAALAGAAIALTVGALAANRMLT